MKIRKSRFLALHPECNAGKLAVLEALQSEYAAYVKTCVDLMVSRRIFSVPRPLKQAFFPPSETLSSQIEKNARDHAIGIVSGWGASTYTLKVKGEVYRLRKKEILDGDTAKVLYTIGKYQLQDPSEKFPREYLDMYWELLLGIVSAPAITERIGIRMSEMTSRLEAPDEADYADYWLRSSTLKFRKSVWLPLVGSPFVKNPESVGKGLLARKTKRGTWRFEVLDATVWEVPDATREMPRIALDVGLNVVAATSDGRLFGKELKPKFNALHEKVLSVRANRRRQGLLVNSPRLDRLESRLTGLSRTATGRVANELVAAYPGSVFVVEDLNLSGCKGSKRFCYRALHSALASKAPTEAVNPAYTSQECPSCHYISKRNRSGIRFSCRSCGRKAHADWVGASGVLRRSEDKSIGCDDHHSVVKEVLRKRYRTLRDSLSGSLLVAPEPSGLGLTVGVFRKEVPHSPELGT